MGKPTVGHSKKGGKISREELTASVLWTEVNDLARELLRELYVPGKGWKSPIRAFKPDEGYVEDTLFAAEAILETCDQLQYSVQCLSHFKSASKLTATRLEHIHYHIENHIVRSVGLEDRAFWLLNVVFELGLPERECKERTVLCNSHIVDTAVAEVFKDLRRLIDQPLRDRRNIFVHKRSLRDPAFEPVQAFFLLEKEGAPEVVKYRAFGRDLTNDIVTKRQGELSAFNGQVILALRKLFDELAPTFQVHHKRLRNGA